MAEVSRIDERRSTFVGRTRELELLRAGLAATLAGSGKLFLLVGEPGIGKTRLADELATHAREQGAQVLWGRCWEGEGAPPFWPWVQVLRSILHEADPTRLGDALDTAAAAVAQVVPELGRHGADLPVTPPHQPPAARFQLFDGLATFLKNTAQRRPTVLILDDLHAADETSVQLLLFLTRAIQHTPLLVIGTYRDVEIVDEHPLAAGLGALVREGRAIHLRGLSEDDVARFITNLTGTRPTSRLLAAVFEATEGNPFYVSEIVRRLDADGRLHLSYGSVGPLAVPHGVRETVGGRLRRLSGETNELLTCAAVIGRAFDVDLLARVLGGSTARLWSRERVMRAVEGAVAARLIVELPVVGGYRFAHTLVRDALCEALSPVHLARLHGSVAAALEGLAALLGDPPVAELAYHYFEAARGGCGDTARAVAYARLAGDRATRQLAYEEAAAHFERALQVLDVAQPDDQRQRCELLVRCGEACMQAGDDARGRAVLAQAADLAHTLGAHELRAQAALAFGGTEIAAQVGRLDATLIRLLEESLAALGEGDSVLRVRLVVRLTTALYWSAARGRMAALADQALAMAQRLGDPTALACALIGQQWAQREPDDLAVHPVPADAGAPVVEQRPAASVPPSANVFRQEGGYWAVGYDGKTVRLRHSKGLQYVAHLLRHPGRELHVLDLIVLAEGPVDGRVAAYWRRSSAQSLAVAPDAQARATYRQRLQTLREELEEAERFNDAGRSAKLRDEVDFVSAELGVLYGVGNAAGRSAPIERVRKAVSNRIRDAMARIAAAHPGLGQHLSSAVRTGVFCAYRPVERIEWD